MGSQVTKKLGVGIIGCGNISSIYLKNGTTLFDNLEIRAVADLDLARAQARATEFGVAKVCSVKELLADKSIDVVLNLTVPLAHYSVCKAALEAGKHVYVEKPLAVKLEEGEELAALAKAKGLYLGGAPDTFLGGGIQTCVKLIEDGWIGTPIGATAFMVCGGHEHWHPDPAFYYQVGGGPMFDMGPYYLTALVALLGPAVSVAGMTSKARGQRTISSAPKKGTVMDVEVPTHIAGLVRFASGATATVVTSFDVAGGSSHVPLEIWGTGGTLQVPDPNAFGGPVRYRKAGQSEWSEIPLLFGYAENSRGLGLSEMATAISEGRPARAGVGMTLHVLELMHAFHRSADTKRQVTLKTTGPASRRRLVQ
ncbi:MAG: Gfo/Idh/MocA family oxidoreductase [Spirochaetales bacterium]